MQKSTITATLLLLPLLVTALTGCGAKEPPKPPEKITNVTVAPVTQKDLRITETAVGMETALGVALDYDPTRGAANAFYVRLPFPEHVASRLKPGQAVVLASFAGDRAAPGRIHEIRPPLNITTQTRDVVVAVTNSGWRPEGSIRGEVELGVHRNAIVAPEQAVVLRRAGTVLYVVEGELASERRVKTGLAREGAIEILDGVRAGETVVVDGAALLSDKAKIRIREPAR